MPASGNTKVRSDWVGGDLVFYDRTNNNEVYRIPARGTQLTAGAVGVVTAGTISGTTSAGANPTVTVTDCTDMRGSFLLNPVTGGGAQAAGKTATVRFTSAFATAPSSVVLTVVNETDGTVVAGAGALALDVNGFDVYTPLLTTAKAYRVYYHVR